MRLWPVRCAIRAGNLAPRFAGFQHFLSAKDSPPTYQPRRKLLPLFVQFLAPGFAAQFQHSTFEVRFVSLGLLRLRSRFPRTLSPVQPRGLLAGTVQLPGITAPAVTLEPLLSDLD